MTIYEEMKAKAKECKEKAAATNDKNLKQFYENAAIGFEHKAITLTVEEACIRG